MALLRLQQHYSLLQTSTSHLPTLLTPPAEPSQEPTLAAQCDQDRQLLHSPLPRRANLGTECGGTLAWRAAAPPPRGLAAPCPRCRGRRREQGEPRVHRAGHRRLQQPEPLLRGRVVFVWLVLVPLAQDYFRKQGRGRPRRLPQAPDVPDARLLDIRRATACGSWRRPTSGSSRRAPQVEFDEEDEKGFLGRCSPGSRTRPTPSSASLTTPVQQWFQRGICNQRGLRGPDGWQAIQENYLPPSVQCFHGKEEQTLTHTDVRDGELLTSPNSTLVNTSNGTKDGHEELNGSYPDLKPPSSPTPSKPGRAEGKEELLTSTGSSLVNTSNATKDGREEPNASTLVTKHPRRPLSPYANYPDLKPPSSPTPSKPGR
ncbi:hypothetical protein ZWY2020_019676 [Hordeum vulgare]|nr:hypothetical protein ZWY2020_019676 [Hordeum vulgare]